MKTLTALAAVAALVAGISVASAQGSSMDQKGTMGGSSIRVIGSGKFCVTGEGGALNCKFASLAACQKAAKSSETCAPRPSSTTGSKN